jgi:hypothetical protein
MYLSPDIVRQQISQLLLKYPELAEDQEALELSLESETDAIDLLDQLLARRTETNSLIAALDIHIAEMKQRSNRLSEREDAIRELMFGIMKAAGLPKAERPLATLSIRKGGTKVVIPDDAAVPVTYCKTTVVPDKTAIKKALDTGEMFNWATLETGPETLSVRTK